MFRLFLVLIVSFTLTCSHAEETLVKSQIVSIGLFKNGLAVVRRTVPIQGTGVYRLEDVPNPVHGTFWIESQNAKVVTRVTSRLVDAEIKNTIASKFQEELVGREVKIFFREGRIPTINGKVVKVERAKGEEAWNRTYQQPRYPYYYGNRNPVQPGQFLVIETNTGQAYIDTSMIAYLSTTDKGKTVKRRKPVLLFDVEALAPGPMKVSVMYLSKGMSWAPSYKVDTTDKKELTIEQKTVIKNELEDVEQAELQLITGYPSVKFGHVASPLSPRTNWASFFSQLNQRIQRGHASVRNVMSQQAVAYNRPAAAAGLDLSATPSGEGVDLHYQSMGKRTLQEGDSFSLSVASASAEYKRIVEWAVPDTRKASGQYIQEYERNQNPQKYEDVARDAVQFRNPFKFPMTTGAAMFVSEGRFTGQSLSYFVNSGEKTTLHITRALSIRTRHVEQEEKGGRETVYIGGKRFRKTKVQGELTASNHRKEIVPLVIRRRFSGDLISADNSPRNTLMEEGVYSVNRRNELLWTLDLQPGESKTLKYRYSVLVHF